MKKIFAALFLSIIFLPSSLFARELGFADLRAQFVQLQSQAVWPVEGTDFSDVTSTFGPRIYRNETRYDFHRGVDIHAPTGTDVYAALAGTVYELRSFSGLGETVIIEHEFPAPILYGGSVISTFYTYYGHLSAYSVEEGQVVTPGQKIGEVGNSGNANSDHLHMEIRVGTRCSLEYQTENPDSSCAAGYGYDPHVHPFLLYPTLVGERKVIMQQAPTNSSEGVLLFETTPGDMMINRIQLISFDASGNFIKKHTIEYTQRIGIDATSTDLIDTQMTNVPYIEPQLFSDGEAFTQQIIVPAGYVPESANKTWLVVTDLFGSATWINW